LQRILPTILSRCQVFEFRRVGASEVAAHLRTICDDEKITVPAAALERLARSGEGSIRDSLSLLERAVAFCGMTIKDEDVLHMLGAVRARVLAELIGALAKRDAAGMLAVFGSLVDEGHDLIHFWNALISALRDLLLLRTLDDCRELLSRPPDEAEELRRAAEGMSREDLTRVFQILANLEPGLKSSSQPRFLFEATLIRLASLGAVRPIEEVLGALGDAPAASHPSSPPQKKKPRAILAAEPRRESPAATAPAASDDTAELVDALHRERPMFGAMIAQASELRLTGGELIIRFPDSMEAVKRQVETGDSLQLLREQAERIAGGRVEIRVELSAAIPTLDSPPAAGGSKLPNAEPAARVEPAPEPAKGAAARTGSDTGGLLEQARNEPGVQKLIDAFGAHVVEIRRHDEPAKKPTSGRPARPAEDAP
jgi:DNA polymerase-3 subunit gamma/tau